MKHQPQLRGERGGERKICKRRMCVSASGHRRGGTRGHSGRESSRPQHGPTPSARLSPLLPDPCPPSLSASWWGPHGARHSHTDTHPVRVNEPPVWMAWKFMLETLPSAKGQSQRGVGPPRFKECGLELEGESELLENEVRAGRVRGQGARVCCLPAGGRAGREPPALAVQKAAAGCGGVGGGVITQGAYGFINPEVRDQGVPGDFRWQKEGRRAGGEDRGL